MLHIFRVTFVINMSRRHQVSIDQRRQPDRETSDQHATNADGCVLLFHRTCTACVTTYLRMQVQAGSSFCLAASKGGDLYVWGRGDSGQLGLGDRDSKQVPVLNTAFPEGTEISQAS